MFPHKAHVADPKLRSGGFIDKVIVIGLMVAIAGSALAFGAVEPWSIATLGLLITLLFVLWGVRGALNRRLQIFLPSTAMPIVALILLGVLQGVTITEPGGKRFSVSLDSEATRLATEVILVLFIAFLLSANFLTGAQRLSWLRNFLIYFGLALSVFGMLQRFTWNGKLYWVIPLSASPTSLFGPFVNHSHFAGYVEMIAPIPVALILRRAVRNEQSLLYGFAAAMMGLAVMMSLSRGGMISFTAGMIFIVAFGFKPAAAESAGARRSSMAGWAASLFAPSRIGVIIVMIFTISAGVWWVGADPVIRRFEKGELVMDAPSKDPGKETFFSSRGYIWRDTAAMIRENWVTGIGLGAFQTVYPIYSKRDGALVVSQSHNDYLQILADGGILGAVIALWFIFLLARDAIRASRHRNSLMAGTALGCSAGLFAIFVHSLFDFNFQIPSNALLFLVLCAVVSQIAAEARAQGDQDVSERVPWSEAVA
jgi:O-antigen ligase